MAFQRDTNKETLCHSPRRMIDRRPPPRRVPQLYYIIYRLFTV